MDIVFGPFHLDTLNECLWRDKQAIFLTPKAFAVLRHLAQQPGQLVTKKELLSAVWFDTYVSDAALKVCIRRLRKVLEDDPTAPRFIETAHKRGYRFIAPVTPSPQTVPRSASRVPRLQPSLLQPPTLNTQHPPLSIVGREAELDQLQRWLEDASQGQRQTVFVTGEVGIGKTTVVEAFLEHRAANGPVWIARGQCVEHYGPGEAYLPVLEALGRVCHEREGERLVEVLSRYAPSWLVQMPWLVSDADSERLQRKIRGASQERMLREIAEALEAFTATVPLVLVLEDLQWSDYSTLNLLSFWAQRQEPARVLLIGTYRPVDVNSNGHLLRTIKQELHLHRHCQELELGFLTQADVAQYVATRFGDGTRTPLPQLARMIHHRTDGSPLFMVNVVDYFVSQGVISQAEGHWQICEDCENLTLGVPENLRQMIEKQIAQLSREEQHVLEAASVAGMEYSAAAVAAGLETQTLHVEEVCEDLMRRKQFLRSRGPGEWPDGTVAARYEFIHTLYQNAWYERVPASKRLQLHQRIGERKEQGYGSRVREIAAELALHFEHGRDYARAVRYLQQAAENTTRRSGYREAVDLLTKGLTLLQALPDTPERRQHELALQTSLGMAMQAKKGIASPEAEQAYVRAQELCHQTRKPPQLFLVLRGLHGVYQARGDWQKARQLAEQSLMLAQGESDPAALLYAHYMMGSSLLSVGELLAARTHLEQGVALYASQQLPSHAGDGVSRATYAALACLSSLAHVLGLLGYLDQASQRSQEALTLAQEQPYPYGLVVSLSESALLHLLRRDWRRVQEDIHSALALATDYGCGQYVATGTIISGRVLVEQGQIEEGIARIHKGAVDYQATGVEERPPLLLGLLADAYRQCGRAEEGLALLAEALPAACANGQSLLEAWLHWIRGEILLTQDRKKQRPKSRRGESRETGGRPPASSPQARAEAEASFQQALGITRRQGAKVLELRMAMSLSRLWQQEGKSKEAYRLLVGVYSWFTEGFETGDVQDAQALLKELGG